MLNPEERKLLDDVHAMCTRLDERTEGMEDLCETRNASTNKRVDDVRDDMRDAARNTGGKYGAVSGGVFGIAGAFLKSLIFPG